MLLHYEKLVEDYLQSLHSKLRNFAVEPEFLGMWVHDEDDNKSLFEIFLAARDAGLKELTVAVGAETAKKLDRQRLSKELGSLGELGPMKTSGPMELHVRFKAPDSSAKGPAPSKATAKPDAAGGQKKTEPANPKSQKITLYSGNGKTSAAPRSQTPGHIHPVYQAAIRQAETHIAHEGELPSAQSEQVAVSVEQEGACLGAVLDDKAVVVDARHKGAGGTFRILLDQVCGLMIGRPIQEAQDHAIIRLEAKLRDHSMPPPVTGLLTPRNADPIFIAPQQIVRALYHEYLTKTGRKPEANFWDDNAGPGWADLSAEEKLKHARSAVHDGCRALGISHEGIEILEILGGVRLVLALSPATADMHFAPRMMRLENHAKKALDPRIELQLESVEDRNRRATRTDRTHKLT